MTLLVGQELGIEPTCPGMVLNLEMFHKDVVKQCIDFREKARLQTSVTSYLVMSSLLLKVFTLYRAQ